MAALASALPRPLYSSVQEEEAPVLKKLPTVHIPPYLKRKGWKPTSEADYGGGGAYPECHVAQYPLDMGRKKSAPGSTVALQVDADGTVRYDAIANHGRGAGQRVQSSFKDLVPLANRADVSEEERAMLRPDEEAVNETTERTRLALEKITHGKIKAAQPKHVPKANGDATYIRYTPANQGADKSKQRIIKMTEVQEDPLEPARFKHKKIPRGPGSPPPPVMHSPPRAITKQDQKDWDIPPCISNWKNNKGFTVPLDKRLAADGRGLQDIGISDNFARFTESLSVAEHHARDEVRARAQLQQKLAQNEKTQKEENLRLLAQKAREERSGAPRAAAPALGVGLGGYASSEGSASGSGSDDESESEDEAAIREREAVREEKRREREKELRLNNMGNEQRAKILAREANRDISEKIALGLAKPSASKETLLDSRLFNRESLNTSFGADDANNLYDKPLFAGSSAAAAIYRPRGNAGNDESFGGGTEEGIRAELERDRFALGKAKFEGAEAAEARAGPVQFEKDVTVSLDGSADPFGVESFLDAAKRGGKRAADAGDAGDAGAADSKRRRGEL
ncbi:hypothetical protein CC85DRAFT_284505 [Cutaneotrichosporon oleaginosum]|uniref:Pre-mRNA-processing protein 45 n=1 Tax=Cutaneotrichosporon oleaginosum TaxID=879819 RepID=A0A0J0XR70_9TREE|nr:uncharacterized protein CC85DRAFT_284505 [Cutaneotrichosporon oleaginosum]KLT43580.1 hypothetical protein CC85DRAFT_284505 [Cutaneotrichosporon oleaginosum]TXT05522.1 hypothetical protein COLE_06842 [Cutaneotrichosporon oleaginosum]